MDLTTLVIVLAIVVPGYFVISQLSKRLYSDHNRMDQATEKRYGFQRLENELREKAKEAEKKERIVRNPYHRSAKTTKIKVKQKTQIPVVIKYRQHIKMEKVKVPEKMKNQ